MVITSVVEEGYKPRSVKLPAAVAISAPSCNPEIMQLVGYILLSSPLLHTGPDPRALGINRIAVFLSRDVRGFIAQHHDTHA